MKFNLRVNSEKIVETFEIILKNDYASATKTLSFFYTSQLDCGLSKECVCSMHQTCLPSHVLYQYKW